MLKEKICPECGWFLDEEKGLIYCLNCGYKEEVEMGKIKGRRVPDGSGSIRGKAGRGLGPGGGKRDGSGLRKAKAKKR